jgi:hypothetical protein
MRVCAIAAGMFLGLTGASLADPLDSPGTVYIDGVPCNLACQSYMAWSKQVLKGNQPAAKHAAETSNVKREAPRKRISKRVEPTSSETPPRKKTADVQPAPSPKPEPAPVAMPEKIAPNVEPHDTPAVSAADPAPSATPQPPSESDTPKAEPTSAPKERTPQELVMAALSVAEQMTSAEPPKTSGHDHPDEDKADAASQPAAPNVDNLVAVLIARPNVGSAKALKDQHVAIDKTESGHEAAIRVALTAAGAEGAELSATDASPLDRVISGDVQAAVVKLVSPEAAEAFPDVKGLKVFRVPLTPRTPRP